MAGAWAIARAVFCCAAGARAAEVNDCQNCRAVLGNNSLAWASYLTAVYREPIAPRDALGIAGLLEWMYRCAPGPWAFDPFEPNERKPADVTCTHLPPDAPIRVQPLVVRLETPVRQGVAYVGADATDGLQAHGRYGFFVRRKRAPRPAPNGSWVEVIRMHSWIEKRQFRAGGTFYYAARGTGAWLNVGRSYVDWRWYIVKQEQREVMEEARRRGFDTLQYPSVWRFGAREVVDLRPSASALHTCSAELRTGLSAQLECNCSERQRLLNCGDR
jgi:hypothetical protein